MKKKSTLKNILRILCCFCMLICSTFMFTACGCSPYKGGTSNPDYPGLGESGYDGEGSNPQPEGEPPLSGDESGDTIDEEGNAVVGAIADFSDFFSGYTLLTNGDSTLELKDPITGGNVKFDTILNRQIEVLTQDLLYRLTNVYGTNSTDNRVINGSKQLKRIVPDVNSSNLKEELNLSPNYSLNSNQAVINNNSLITDVDHDASHILTNEANVSNLLDITCLSCYQEAINTNISTNLFYNQNFINLTGAIEGRYTKLSSFMLDPSVLSTNKWLGWDSAKDSTYENVLSVYFNTLKMGIAQILAGEESVTGVYNLNEYNSLLSSVNNLGYFNSQKSKIIDFIKNNIVGETLIKHDNEIEKCQYFIDNENKVVYNTSDIMNSFMFKAPYDDGNGTFDVISIENSPRLYKGYSVVIPAIVEQALSNTFAGTTTSLYPYFKRVNMTEGDFSTYKVENAEGEEVEEYTTTGPVSLNAIILQPKKGAIPVGLQLQIDAELKGKETLAEKKNIVVELQVGIEYVRGNPNDPYIALEDKLIPEYEDSEVVTIDARKGCVVETPSLPDLDGDPSNLPTGSGQVDYEADPNSQGLPFVFQYSFYDLEENFPDGQPAFEEFDDGSFVTSSIPSVPGLPILPGLTPTRTPITERDMFTNVFKDPGDADDIAYNAGLDYIQITFKIVSAKQYSGDGDSELVDYKDIQNILFDISVMPLTY